MEMKISLTKWDEGAREQFKDAGWRFVRYEGKDEQGFPLWVIVTKGA